jgi:WD40 repeat protein
LARNGANQVQAMCYTPDGRSLVTAAGKTIAVWDAHTGEQGTGVLQRTLSGHDGNILAIDFSADGKRLVSIADDNIARQWDIVTGEQVGSVSFDRNAQPTAYQIAIFRPKTTTIVFIAGNEVELRDYETGKQAGNLNLPNESIVAAAFLADGKRIAVALESGQIQVFPIDDPSSKTSLDLKKPARCLAASESKIVTGDTSGEVCVVSIEGDAARLQHRIKAHESAVNAVSIRGDQVATTGDDGVANVFDLTTESCSASKRGMHRPLRRS